ncbi:MAG TPA: SPOR domain-containing protein [Candidatus Polarisedimenticolia bacterium]|nr:SPOR domain-containing protein [Candidatus Polarisedimenticolia bacterium]
MATGSPSAAGAGGDKEFQLESRHLAFLVAIVLALCFASFMLGRWVERRSSGPAMPAAGRPDDANIQEMGDVASDLTFFDSLKGGEPVPLREESVPREASTMQPSAGGSARRGVARRPPSSASAASDPSRSVNEGVMIQVFAGKDRASADAVRKKLRSRGYTALMMSEGGTWKVRVGPYADREEAERSAAVLREQEKLSTWIP